jgi:hypothetical protein
MVQMNFEFFMRRKRDRVGEFEFCYLIVRGGAEFLYITNTKRSTPFSTVRLGFNNWLYYTDLFTLV